MSDDLVIRSRTNSWIVRARSTLAGREPDTIVLQGDRLVDDALVGGHRLEVVLVAEDRRERARELAARGVVVKLVAAEVLANTVSLKTSPGILALGPVPKSIELAALAYDERALFLVVVGIQDPGNLGALARAGAALGVRALVVVVGGVSPWNEKALRGSMGALLRLPVLAQANATSVAREFEARGVRQVRAATRGGLDPRSFDWRGPIALWISGETGELPSAITRFESLTIPLAPGTESLNVAVAASLLLFTSARVVADKGPDGSA